MKLKVAKLSELMEEETGSEKNSELKVIISVWRTYGGCDFRVNRVCVREFSLLSTSDRICKNVSVGNSFLIGNTIFCFNIS